MTCELDLMGRAVDKGLGLLTLWSSQPSGIFIGFGVITFVKHLILKIEPRVHLLCFRKVHLLAPLY